MLDPSRREVPQQCMSFGTRYDLMSWGEEIGI